MLTHVTASLFSERLGEAFQLHLDSGAALTVELSEVSAPAPDRARPFSIVFRAPGDCDLPQGIYRLEHPVIGALELFLVPIGPDRARRHRLYEAVFN